MAPTLRKSLILAAIAACMIDRAFNKAAGFAVAGTILTFFGFMHSEAIGFGKTPLVAISYLGVALLLAACAKYATASAPAQTPHLESHDAMPEPAN